MTRIFKYTGLVRGASIETSIGVLRLFMAVEGSGLSSLKRLGENLNPTRGAVPVCASVADWWCPQILKLFPGRLDLLCLFSVSYGDLCWFLIPEKKLRVAVR